MESSKLLVVKANRLIESKFKFTLWEMRIFTRMVSLVNKDDKDFTLHRLYIKDLINFFGTTSNNDYEIIKNVPRSLAKKQIEVPYFTKEGERRWATMTIFPTVTSPDAADTKKEGAFIELKFNDDLKDLLLELKKLYNKYDIRNVIPLRSSFSFRIFELLKQYETIGKREMTVDDLKEILGVEDKYNLYANFKRKIILQAQKDLEKSCDIRFEFKEKKKGRKVHSIVFLIYSNEPERLKDDKTNAKRKAKKKSDVVVESSSGELEELYAKIQQWISRATFNQWLESYPEDQIVAGILYTLQKLEGGANIKNVGGYLSKMVGEAQLSAPFQKEPQQVRQKKREQEEIKAKKAELEDQKRDLYEELRFKEADVIQEIFQEYPEAQKQILEKMRSDIFSPYDPQKSLEEQLDSPLFAGTYHHAIKEKFPEHFSKLQEEYQPKIDGIQKELLLL